MSWFLGQKVVQLSFSFQSVTHTVFQHVYCFLLQVWTDMPHVIQKAGHTYAATVRWDLRDHGNSKNTHSAIKMKFRRSNYWTSGGMMMWNSTLRTGITLSTLIPGLQMKTDLKLQFYDGHPIKQLLFVYDVQIVSTLYCIFTFRIIRWGMSIHTRTCAMSCTHMHNTVSVLLAIHSSSE